MELQMMKIFLLCAFSSFTVALEFQTLEAKQAYHALSRDISAKTDELFNKTQELKSAYDKSFYQFQYFTQLENPTDNIDRKNSSPSLKKQALLKHLETLSNNCSLHETQKCYNDIRKIMDDDYENARSDIFRLMRTFQEINRTSLFCIILSTVGQVPCVGEARNHFNTILKNERISSLGPTELQKLLSDWIQTVQRK